MHDKCNQNIGPEFHPIPNFHVGIKTDISLGRLYLQWEL